MNHVEDSTGTSESMVYTRSQGRPHYVFGLSEKDVRFSRGARVEALSRRQEYPRVGQKSASTSTACLDGLWTVYEMAYQNLLMDEGSKDPGVMYVLTDLTAGKPPGTGALQKNWNRALLLIDSGPWSLLPGSLRDSCINVLGLRIVVSEALRRHFGQLLRQRQ